MTRLAYRAFHFSLLLFTLAFLLSTMGTEEIGNPIMTGLAYHLHFHLTFTFMFMVAYFTMLLYTVGRHNLPMTPSCMASVFGPSLSWHQQKVQCYELIKVQFWNNYLPFSYDLMKWFHHEVVSTSTRDFNSRECVNIIFQQLSIGHITYATWDASSVHNASILRRKSIWNESFTKKFRQQILKGASQRNSDKKSWK